MICSDLCLSQPSETQARKEPQKTGHSSSETQGVSTELWSSTFLYLNTSTGPRLVAEIHWCRNYAQVGSGALLISTLSSRKLA